MHSIMSSQEAGRPPVQRWYLALDADPDGQTLLVWYPEVEPRDGAYVRPAVRIESGAKSALDPNPPCRDPAVHCR